MIAAAVAVDDEAERRPPARVGDVVGAVLPEILDPVAEQPGDEQPRGAGDRRSRDNDEDRRDAALDGKHAPAPVGDGEPDVDRGDQRPGRSRTRSRCRATRRRVATQPAQLRRRAPTRWAFAAVPALAGRWRWSSRSLVEVVWLVGWLVVVVGSTAMTSLPACASGLEVSHGVGHLTEQVGLLDHWHQLAVLDQFG